MAEPQQQQQQRPNITLFTQNMATPPTTPPGNKSSTPASTSAARASLALSPREAILDALYRLVTSYDTDDLALHDSAWTAEQPTFTLVNTSSTYLGLSRIQDIFHDVRELDTTHHISNPRITIAADGKSARVTATVSAQHYRQGEGMTDGAPSLSGGSLYDAQVEKDEGNGLWRTESEVWRIRSLKMKVVWTEGDGSIVAVRPVSRDGSFGSRTGSRSSKDSTAKMEARIDSV